VSYYYICDRCGNLVTVESEAIPDGQDWECDACGSHALWEFPNKDHALAHGAMIARRASRSGIFRTKP